MENQIKFDNATKSLFAGKISEFYSELIAIYNNISCSCFFNRQEDSTYKKQLLFIEQIEDDDSNFELNVVKGLINFWNKKNIDAYKYFSNSIKLNSTADLPYSLRARLGI